MNQCSTEFLLFFAVEENPSQTDKKVQKPKAKEAQKVQKVHLAFLPEYFCFWYNKSLRTSVMSLCCRPSLTSDERQRVLR